MLNIIFKLIRSQGFFPWAKPPWHHLLRSSRKSFTSNAVENLYSRKVTGSINFHDSNVDILNYSFLSQSKVVVG